VIITKAKERSVCVAGSEPKKPFVTARINPIYK